MPFYVRWHLVNFHNNLDIFCQSILLLLLHLLTSKFSQHVVVTYPTKNKTVVAFPVTDTLRHVPVMALSGRSALPARPKRAALKRT